jgi:quinol monooxygenase YgiN
MVNVIAAIRVKPGKRTKFLEIFKANIPSVIAEQGCIEYLPTVDLDAGLPPQSLDENMVTILEMWESLEALRDHLKAPHMKAYRTQVKDLVAEMTLKILQEA